jgi:class 3 adenylate cyclase
VHRFEGTVNKYAGDGIMALSSAPRGYFALRDLGLASVKEAAWTAARVARVPEDVPESTSIAPAAFAPVSLLAGAASTRRDGRATARRGDRARAGGGPGIESRK